MLLLTNIFFILFDEHKFQISQQKFISSEKFTTSVGWEILEQEDAEQFYTFFISLLSTILTTMKLLDPAVPNFITDLYQGNILFHKMQ